MNSRIEKLDADISKTKTQISKLQTRLHELEDKKLELENVEIVSLFRSVDVPPDELANFIQAFKEQTQLKRREADNEVFES